MKRSDVGERFHGGPHFMNDKLKGCLMRSG